MVSSRIVKSVNFPETRALDSEDIAYNATVYPVVLDGADVDIALGQPKYSFIDEGIVYFPIYLVKGDTFDLQIGVYEIMSSRLPSIVSAGDDGEVDVSKLVQLG